MTTARPATEAWRRLADGNERFVDDRPEHPRQDADRRAELASGQQPVAAILGCSDSRVAAEVLFDQGLGDLFVIRNAGQVASASAIASIEYAVAVLGVPLVVVLAHDRCGAVKAAIDAAGADAPLLPPPHRGAHRPHPAGRRAAASGTDADERRRSASRGHRRRACSPSPSCSPPRWRTVAWTSSAPTTASRRVASSGASPSATPAEPPTAPIRPGEGAR